jgi:N-hydroxyarylamine O-acetyltransferase
LDTQPYLRRIGYSGPLQPTLETLRALHYAHLVSVPFENLDIHRQVPILLDEASLFRKIVEAHRGGYCYELNGLFAALLRELGFKVSLLSARVPTSEDVTSPEFDHLCLRVDLQFAWLADVGFGESFIEPLALVEDVESLQRDTYYSVDQQEGRWRVLRCAEDDPRGVPVHKQADRDWRMLYDLTVTPRQLPEFEARSQFHQTSPESHFTRRRICSRLTADGRVTLTGTRLVRTGHGQRSEAALASLSEYSAALQENFGIQPDARDCNVFETTVS